MDRYKVKLPTDDAFTTARHLISDQVPVYVTSEKRRFLSTGHLPDDLRQRIEGLGGSVTREYRYAPDVAAGSTGPGRDCTED